MTEGEAAASWLASDRERRLWLWTTAVVVGIYATLGLARTLADELSDQGLLVPLFVFGLALCGAAIVTQALRTRPGGVEIGIALGVGAVYLMIFQRMGMAVERSHLFEYTVLALLIHEALLERASHGRRVPVPAVLAFVATVLVGTLDEVIQLLIPSRVFDPIDIGFNALAAFMAVVASVALRWARRRKSGR